MTVSDGRHFSQPLRIPLQIMPRVLLEQFGNQLINNSVVVNENGTVALHPSIFPFKPSPTPTPSNAGSGASGKKGAPHFFIFVMPTKGHFVHSRKGKVTQFTFDDIKHSRLAYQHGPAEVGLHPVYDVARIWDFNAGSTFSLNFTIIPVNSQPPVLKAEAPVQVRRLLSMTINIP